MSDTIKEWANAVAYASRNPAVTVEQTEESILKIVAFACDASPKVRRSDSVQSPDFCMTAAMLAFHQKSYDKGRKPRDRDEVISLVDAYRLYIHRQVTTHKPYLSFVQWMARREDGWPL